MASEKKLVPLTMIKSLDLFSGVGGITHALRGLATPVTYCEKDTDCHVVLRKLMSQGKLPKAPIHPDVARLSASSLPGKVDMIVAGFPCFPAGTLVNTSTGYVPIEQVTGEHLLLTHTGQHKPINNLQRKLLPAGQPMYSLKIKGLYRPIRCTEEHPFYARRLRTVDGAPQYSPPEFVEAKDLSTDHVVGIPIDRRAVVPSNVSDPGQWHALVVTEVPDWVHAAPAHLLEAFVDGYKAADAPLEVTLGMQRVLAKIGRAQPHCWVEGEHMWCKLEEIDVQTTTEAQWVYNFEVDDDNSYCVENVAVHNCIGFSSSGKREGLDQVGSRLFYHVMRLARDLRPPLMFFENVDAILGNDDIHKIVRAIRKLDYAMYWVVMPAWSVGAPQKRGRWFCLCVRRGVTGVQVRPSEPFVRFNWKSEPAVRMVPRDSPDVVRRMRMLGNGVVPDCVRAAFLSLFTGCRVPIPRLFSLSSRGSPPMTLSPPQPLGPLLPTHSKAYACVVDGTWQRIAEPPGMLPRPQLKLVLDPNAFKSKKPISKDATSGFIKKPKPITLWSTIRANNGAFAMNVLTNRGSHDLGSQLRFERRTPASQRKGVTNPKFGEWLMGLPQGWTSSS